MMHQRKPILALLFLHLLLLFNLDSPQRIRLTLVVKGQDPAEVLEAPLPDLGGPGDRLGGAVP